MSTFVPGLPFLFLVATSTSLFLLAVGAHLLPRLALQQPQDQALLFLDSHFPCTAESDPNIQGVFYTGPPLKC